MAHPDGPSAEVLEVRYYSSDTHAPIQSLYDLDVVHVDRVMDRILISFCPSRIAEDDYSGYGVEVMMTGASARELVNLIETKLTGGN